MMLNDSTGAHLYQINTSAQFGLLAILQFSLPQLLGTFAKILQILHLAGKVILVILWMKQDAKESQYSLKGAFCL